MPEVGFEPTIPVFEQGKTIHGLDRAATVIGCVLYAPCQLYRIIIIIIIVEDYKLSHLYADFCPAFSYSSPLPILLSVLSKHRSYL
jgi:hypothetical protein